MPVYNKLKIAILTILSTQTVSALTLEPIQIQSGAGNLLYAEMKFRNADPNARIEASLAETEDLMSLGMPQQATGSLNFFTRRSGDGTGVIVITSSRPIIDTELNILLKIKEGNATHIQQVKSKLSRPNQPSAKASVATSTQEKSLQPQTVVSEKDIALNLPVSAQYNVPAMNTVQSTQKSSAPVSSHIPSSGTPLVINVTPVPQLNSSSRAAVVAAASQNQTQTVKSLNTAIPQKSVQSYDIPSIAMVEPMMGKPAPAPEVTQSTAKAIEKAGLKLEKASVKATDAIAKNPAKVKDHVEVNEKAKVQPPAPAPAPQLAQNEHVVQANESLWKIASRVAAHTHQSVPEVMKQIKANNEHAFIGGNINRMRKGVALNLAAPVPTAKKISKVATEPNYGTQKQSAKEKYRISQAEMSLIAENKQDSAQGSAKEKTSQNQTSSELSAKVMTAREKTVKLQKNVSKLTLALQQKDQRIQLLNARLAQLQQQLQQQNRAKKPAH